LYAGRAKNPLKYRVAMLYLCGYNIEETANAVGLSSERVRQLLTIICLGVE
jgi:DNA-directed RNA polymerase specialized sigma24 family protein